MGGVVERVCAAVKDGRRITVHGDFDVDGVCATTILISTLRELGAECDWLIPDRLVDGYGDRKSTRLNSSHPSISYAVFCLKKKKKKYRRKCLKKKKQKLQNARHINGDR